MKSRLLLIAKLAFVALLCTLVYLHKSYKPRILIVHSYLDDYSWVREINTGIKRFIGDREDVTVRYHYMDLKNHGDEAFKRTSAEITRRTIDRWQPDILILFDDVAQKLVGVNYIDKPGMSIVYGGMNGTEADYGYDKAANVTGILERKPLKAVEDTVMMMWQASGGDPEQKPSVLLVGDASFSFNAGLTAYEPPQYTFNQVEWLPPEGADVWEDYQKLVQRIHMKADILFVSDWRMIKKVRDGKEFVPPKEVMKWTEENCRIPILSLVSVGTEDGGGLAVAASGYEQGEEAARMAYAIAKGKPASEIPNKSTEQFLISLRKSAIEKRHLKVPAIYEAFARATDNFYE